MSEGALSARVDAAKTAAGAGEAQGAQGPKPRLAVFKMSSCDGCQLQLLDAEEALLALAGAVGFTAAASFADSTVISLICLSMAAAGVLTCAPLFWSLPFCAAETASTTESQMCWYVP